MEPTFSDELEAWVWGRIIDVVVPRVSFICVLSLPFCEISQQYFWASVTHKMGLNHLECRK
jgi:hypothetical protein